MYIKVTQNQISGGLYCVPFEYISNQEECEDIFKREFSNSDLIVYSPAHNTIVPLGYFVIDNQSIVESRHYNTFVHNCVELTGINPSDTLSQIECKHISEWVLDEALKSNALLTSLFTSIISAFMPKNGTISYGMMGVMNYAFTQLKTIVISFILLPSHILFLHL